jgi:hypothetical protein
MATLLDLLDRCISAGPTDGDLGATAIRVLRIDEAADEVAPEWDDDDEDDVCASWFDDEDDDVAPDLDADDDVDEALMGPGRWLLAVGECG